MNIQSNIYSLSNGSIPRKLERFRFNSRLHLRRSPSSTSIMYHNGTVEVEIAILAGSVTLVRDSVEVPMVAEVSEGVYWVRGQDLDALLVGYTRSFGYGAALVDESQVVVIDTGVEFDRAVTREEHYVGSLVYPAVTFPIDWFGKRLRRVFTGSRVVDPYSKRAGVWVNVEDGAYVTIPMTSPADWRNLYEKLRELYDEYA